MRLALQAAVPLVDPPLPAQGLSRARRVVVEHLGALVAIIRETYDRTNFNNLQVDSPAVSIIASTMVAKKTKNIRFMIIDGSGVPSTAIRIIKK